jgi:hypothetical protein
MMTAAGEFATATGGARMPISHHHAIRAYIQKGAPDFPSQHRDLSEHMRAAFRVSQAPPLPNPGETGTLDTGSVATLFQIFSFVGTNWNIAGQSSVNLAQFTNGFINLKTNQTPSYLTAYRNALEFYATLVNSLGTEVALQYLYSSAPPQPPPVWYLTRAWTIQEFIKYYVSQGAFRTYGWMLYPGFGGGPFDNPNALPYRPAANGR